MDKPRRVPPSRWLELATFRISFGPDRKAVRRELEEHLEDKALDLQRIFPELTEKEALEQAAADMGDPVALGKELSQIHRPFWGYLWRCSQVALAGAFLAALFTLGGQVLDGALGDWRDWWEENQRGKQFQEMLFGSAEPSWEGERVRLYPLEPDLYQEQGNGAFTLSQAALWREEGEYVLFLDVRVDFDLPWHTQERLVAALHLEDSLGNVYTDGYVTYRGNQRGLGWLQYNLMLQDFDPAAEWVRLTYFPGTELSLTVDLTQGVEA